jgi:hypothetical protein
VDIPAGRSAVVTCPSPWVPVVENGGHECLMAEAYQPKFDPLTAPMDPMDDRHVGQKNEYLVVVAPGGDFSARIHAANIAPLVTTVAFEVLAVRSRTVPQLIEVQARDLRHPVLAPTTQLPVSLKVEAGTEGYVPPSELFARRLLSYSELVTAGREEAACPLALISRSATLEPSETRVLELSGTVPMGTPVGTTFQFRAVQRIGPVVTGGYTVSVLVGER